MTIPPADLDTLEKMEREATKAPWAVHPIHAQIDAMSESPTPVCQLLWPTDIRTEAETLANARSIAAARNSLPALLRMARRCVEMEAALRKAIDLISIPASRHHDGRDHITGSPRYSAGLLKHHAECAALLPVLKAALGERP